MAGQQAYATAQKADNSVAKLAKFAFWKGTQKDILADLCDSCNSGCGGCSGGGCGSSCGSGCSGCNGCNTE